MATTTYEHSTTTSSSGDIGLDRFYLRNWRGILKIAQCAVDLIAFICASVWLSWANYGGAWVQFVTMSAFITTLVLYFFHLFRIIYKLPGPWGLIELIYYCLYTLMLLVAAIVCAARARWDSSIAAAAEFIYYCVYTLMMLIAAIVAAVRAPYHSSIAATAFFTFAATALYLVDTFFLFRDWRSGTTTSSSATTTTTTTRTETSYETRTQY